MVRDRTRSAPLSITLAALVVLGILAGVGMTVRPHMGVPGADQPAGPGDERLGPFPPSTVTGEEERGPVVDRICRARGTPSGGVVIAYEVGGRDCPPPSDATNPYTVTVIERHDRRPVGSQMAICADQRVPRGWIRHWTPDELGECPGARVGDDTSTRVLIRRSR
jgi:hypothetical protein